jgi:VanZ family protein
VRRYGPVLLWILVIYVGSSAELSASNTSRVIRPLLLWLFPDITEPALLSAHFYVRKAAHFTEYAVLALLAARALLGSAREGVRRNWAALSFAFVAACALLDEFHQSFLSARTGTIYDSLLDMIGGACALAAVGLYLRLSRRKGRKLLKNKG